MNEGVVMGSILRNVKKLDVFVAVILIAKIIGFYSFTDLSAVGIIIGLVTFATYGIVFYCNLVSKKKDSWKRFMAFYGLISAMMYIDCLYYGYYNQLISINQIFQINKFLAIKKSFKFLAYPVLFIMIMDIPLMGFYFRNLKQRLGNINPLRYAYSRRVALASFMVIIFALALNPFNADTVKAINHNEVLTYHIYDLYTNIFGEADDQIQSEEDVAQVLQENQFDQIAANHYKGIAKGRNVIMIQVESLENFVIDRSYNGQVLTPNLNGLIDDQQTMYFENYFETIGKGNTSDAEFSTLNSIYPNIEGSCYEKYPDNTFNGIPWILRDKGYYAMSFHGYEGNFWNREQAHPVQGFQDFYSAEDFVITDTMGYGMVDKDFFKQSLEKIKTLPKPFFSFLITLSSHHPYEVPAEFTDIRVKEADLNTEFGNYMQAVHYTDEALGQFIQGLKDEDLYEDSIIVIYGDHFALNCRKEVIDQQMTDFLGYDYDYDDMLNVPMMIHIPGKDVKGEYSMTGGGVDMLPTLMNLMGYKVDSPYIFGRDLLNITDDGFVSSVTYILRGSFVKEGVMFEYSQDGIYDSSRAWDIKTQKPRDIEDYQEAHKQAKNLIDASKYVLDNNLITRE